MLCMRGAPVLGFSLPSLSSFYPGAGPVQPGIESSADPLASQSDLPVSEQQSPPILLVAQVLGQFNLGFILPCSLASHSDLTGSLPLCFFLLLQVLGQFNLGFILARLDRDLFIVDQHASGAMQCGLGLHEGHAWAGG